MQGVSRRLQSGLTDTPSQRQGKRVACAFSQMVLHLHSARTDDHGDPPSAAAADIDADPGLEGGFMPAEDPGVLYADEDLSLIHI